MSGEMKEPIPGESAINKFKDDANILDVISDINTQITDRVERRDAFDIFA